MKSFTLNRVFGRMQEEVDKLTSEQKQRGAIKRSLRIGGDDTLKVFATREAMAKLIRRQEKSAPNSEWSPLIKLQDAEGY